MEKNMPLWGWLTLAVGAIAMMLTTLGTVFDIERLLPF